jgi:hypothetical protein
MCCGKDNLPVLMNRFNSIQQNRQRPTTSAPRSQSQMQVSSPPPPLQLQQPRLSNTTEKIGRFVKFIRSEQRVQEILEHQQLIDKLQITNSQFLRTDLNNFIQKKVEKVQEEKFNKENSNIEHLNVILRQELNSN